MSEKTQPVKPTNPLFIALRRSLDTEAQLALDERAAICEHEGGLTQNEAEKLAYDLWRDSRLNIET